PDDLTQMQVEVEIDPATIDTRDENRDNHLRSADFLEVEKYPKMTFVSRQVRAKGGNKYEVVGDLTIRDVTRPVVLDTTFEGRVTDPWGNERLGFSATAELNRQDYGLKWNTPLEAGGVLVGDQVRIHLEVEAVRENA